MINTMERVVHHMYMFGKNRSMLIAFILLANAYFIEQKDFIFAEVGRKYLSKINHALLGVAHSTVAMAVSYCIYLTFKEQPYSPINSYNYSQVDFSIDVIAIVMSFFSPLVVMKSTLILLLFASGLVLLLYCVLFIYNLFHKNPDESDAPEPRSPSPTMRTRSGMIFGQRILQDNELLRLRDQSVKRSPSVAIRSSGRRSVK